MKKLTAKCSICGVILSKQIQRQRAKVTSFGFECGDCRWMKPILKPKRTVVLRSRYRNRNRGAIE